MDAGGASPGVMERSKLCGHFMDMKQFRDRLNGASAEPTFRPDREILDKMFGSRERSGCALGAVRVMNEPEAKQGLGLHLQ
jgi:hypothetical protein